jgi:hypothetical protein
MGTAATRRSWKEVNPSSHIHVLAFDQWAALQIVEVAGDGRFARNLVRSGAIRSVHDSAGLTSSMRLPCFPGQFTSNLIRGDQKFISSADLTKIVECFADDENGPTPTDQARIIGAHVMDYRAGPNCGLVEIKMKSWEQIAPNCLQFNWRHLQRDGPWFSQHVSTAVLTPLNPARRR